MSDIGFSDQVPSLPDGGGSASGIGATFTPDLSTGTGGLSIPLDTPNGPNDIGPKLSLQYSTANGNGPFGFGFSLALPRLVIDTEYGFPNYDGNDTVLLEGSGPLLALGGGVYRPQVDGGAWRIQQSGAGYQLMTREAAVYTLGVDAAARSADPANSASVFAWYLESIVDALGYKATFTWRSDGGQLYLNTIAYGAYVVAFTYEARSDAFRSAQSGFTVTTGLRCTQIELQLVGDAQPAARRWTLAYSADPLNGASLLKSVTLSGLDETGAITAAPPLTLGYSTVGAPSLIRLGASGDAGLPTLTLGPTRRADLVDWNGDGLPDILQVAAGGQSYVWLNTGDTMFQGPSSAGLAPGFAQADAAIAFADMDGDGFADLIRYDQPLAGYVPRTAPGGFGQPVSWTQAPAQPVASPGVRVIDLNGDGIPDLLTSSEFGLTLYYRAGSQGWTPTPRVVPQGVAPDVDLADPHVFLADMTGDGAYDIVRVTGGGVTYWPYLGSGRWDAPVIMADSPSLPFNVNVARLFLTDIDGDGCSDLIYLAPDRVIYWINRAGISFGPPLTIDYVPGNAIVEPRLADMTGSGTAGLVWTSNGPFGAGTQYFYLEFVGATAPRLLTSIDNGVGLVTTVSYTTSAQEAARAARAGNPWSTTMPIALPIVKSMSIADTATDNVRTSQFAYRDGRYDGVLREFAGFGQVDQTDVGDTVAPGGVPTLLTSSWFHIGVDPAQPEAPLDLPARQMLRAIRGRLYQRQRYGQDGSPVADNPYDRTEYTWTVTIQSTAGGSVFLPRLASTVQTVFERTATAVSSITTTNNAWDANGNVTDATETAVSGATTVQTLRTTTAYATDPAGHFISKAYRVQQFDGTGTIVADQVIVYDNAAEGQTGTQGLVTSRSSLAIADATVTAVYGTATPDFASYHYFRRTDSQGWWVNQGQYERTVDASGLHGTAEGPNGGVFTVVYDANQTFPVAITDPLGNKVSATYDYRVSRVSTLTAASGEMFSASFDPLARMVARVEPGDSATLPTITYTYDTAQIPVSRTESTRATSGSSATVDKQTIYRGDGNTIEQREFDETGAIAVRSLVMNARGLLAQDYLAWRPASPTYSAPAVTLPHSAFTYDALGRPLTRTDADGNVTFWTFGPATVDQTDATGKTTRTQTDATGRIVAIEEHPGSATLTSTYTFDVKGNLIQHTDAVGQVVKTWYDALGRVLRVQRPEHDASTVFDAAGNPVESRTPTGITLTRTYDLCNRPVTVSVPGAATPALRYTYDDAGGPPPPDAGTHTAGGRCVRIDDQSGSSTFDYDARGRTVIKRSTPTGNPQRVLTLAYRADGQLTNVTYPSGATTSLSVAYQYDKRGLVSSIPGVVSAVSYDLRGRRTSVGYANGVTSTYAYDNAERLTELNHANTSGALRQTQFSRDGVGNLTQIVSPDSTLAATFSYDDLHRLIQAATGAGDVRTYAYDNAGNLTSKSDVGSYAYGENGMPATCLTTAGSAKFTYTALGQMEQTPWGTQSFDAFGRLVTIAGSTSATFTYDYSGSRVSTQFTSGGVTTTRLTPDALYAIENGTLVNYLFDGLRFIARDVDGAARTYLHEDHVGSLVLITDATGAVADSIRYDAFGAIVARQAAGSNVPVGFAQGTFDNASGLLYLQSRYYHPQFGRFVSPDSVVPDVFLPIAWNAYAYCANNPQTYADPSGHAWWQILVGILAVIALVALTVVTFGFAAPAAAAIGTATLVALYATVAVGVVAGGIIGGIAASKAGGSIGDIILGALVGAAVGGWAALGSFVAGGAISAALGPTSHLLADVVAGATAGAINGAATGFATGFAGGKGTLDQTLADIALGALIGFVVGGALGGAQYALSGAPPTAPTTNPGQTPPGPPTDPTGSGVQNPSLSATNSVPSAALKAASPWLSYAGQLAARPILMSPFIYTADVLLTDTATGVLDMGYGPQILEWLKQNNITI